MPNTVISLILSSYNQALYQQIIIVYLYYAREVNNTILIALKFNAEIQGWETEETENNMTHFLNYLTKRFEEMVYFRRR